MALTVRLCAVIVSALLVASFALFALDQAQEGSTTQVNAVSGSVSSRSPGPIDQPSPAAGVERVRESAHSKARELIDDANDVLVSPFASLVTARDPWAPRMVSGAAALLLFGLGGMLLANVLPRPRHEVTDWREATS